MLKPMIFAAAAILSAPAAWAAGSNMNASATLEWRHEPQDRVVLEDVAWRCAGKDCSGPILSSGSNAIAQYCRMLSRYGEVTRFSADGEQLSEEALERCNKRGSRKSGERQSSTAAKAN